MEDSKDAFQGGGPSHQVRLVDSDPSLELSVVIPTYNGAGSLPQLLDRLAIVLQEHGVAYEVIIVNDASPDDTWTVLESTLGKHRELRAIDLMVNHGQAIASLCGLAHARGQLIATMDDDLQHPPEELPRLLQAMEQHPGWDAVVGSWPRDEGLLRDIGSWINEAVDRWAHGTPKGFRHTAYRVMRRRLVAALVSHDTRTPVLWSLLWQCSNRIHNLDVEHSPRPYGRSGFTLRYGLKTVATNFFQASTLPLRTLSAFGMTVSIMAALVATAYVLRWSFGATTPPGWTSSFLAITFFGGASLFGLGLIGEYISLIMQEVRRPPPWNIRDSLMTPTAEDSTHPEWG